jgi:hypothetical protein
MNLKQDVAEKERSPRFDFIPEVNNEKSGSLFRENEFRT